MQEGFNTVWKRKFINEDRRVKKNRQFKRENNKIFIHEKAGDGIILEMNTT